MIRGKKTAGDYGSKMNTVPLGRAKKNIAKLRISCSFIQSLDFNLVYTCMEKERTDVYANIKVVSWLAYHKNKNSVFHHQTSP